MFLKDVCNEINGFGSPRWFLVGVSDGSFAMSSPLPGSFHAKVCLARTVHAHWSAWERAGCVVATATLGVVALDLQISWF